MTSKTTLWRIAVLLGLGAAASTYAAPPAEVLTLDSYLTEVRARHEGLRGAGEAAEGAKLRSEEGSLLLAPTLFGNATLQDDRKPNQLFQSLTGTVSNSYALGISKVFGTTGTSAKVSYTLGYFQYDGNLPGAPNGTSFYEARPTIELSQPLWRNFLGYETRANQTALEAQSLASHYQNRYQVRATLAQAEATYWRLVLARRNLDIQHDALERAKRIHEWSQKRANLQLADRSDLLQAQANLDLRELQTQAAEDEVRASSLLFNQARGAASETVSEKTVALEEKRLDDFKLPVRGMREDLRAAQEQERASVARAEIGLSTESPVLELFGSYSWNGQKTERSDAISQSLGSQLPTRVVGIRLSAPLDIPTILDARAGYRKERLAAELSYQRRAFEVDRDWTDLNARFVESRRRLVLARSIEDVQKRKLTYERERLSRGRTTLYQVLLFEQDYSQSQLSRLQEQAEVLKLIAQLRLAAGEPDGEES